MESVGRELGAETMNVDVQAGGIQRLAVFPGCAPEFFRPHDAVYRTRQARHQQKFHTRQVQRLSAAGEIKVFVLNAEIAVVINLVFN